jgi:hypothetical protein
MSERELLIEAVRQMLLAYETLRGALLHTYHRPAIAEVVTQHFAEAAPQARAALRVAEGE